MCREYLTNFTPFNKIVQTIIRCRRVSEAFVMTSGNQADMMKVGAAATFFCPDVYVSVFLQKEYAAYWRKNIVTSDKEKRNMLERIIL